jgi:hypothetical protein
MSNLGSQLRGPLAIVLDAIKDGQCIGFPAMTRDDLQALVLYALADIYKQLQTRSGAPAMKKRRPVENQPSCE